MKGESAEAKRRFEKEAGILNTVKGHRNVAEFLRFCQDPYAIMMEYSCFDLSPFGVDKKVSLKILLLVRDLLGHVLLVHVLLVHVLLVRVLLVQSSPVQSSPVFQIQYAV